MRKIVLVAALAVAPLAALAAPAAAVCDPDYRPLCVNSCFLQPPDPRDPLAALTRVCPM